MVRTTVMLAEETHARLRRLAQQRGIPLARLIREALTDAAEPPSPTRLSFIGAVSVDIDLAEQSIDELPPITSPVSDIADEELERLRQRFAAPGAAC